MLKILFKLFSAFCCYGNCVLKFNPFTHRFLFVIVVGFPSKTRIVFRRNVIQTLNVYFVLHIILYSIFLFDF